MCWGIETGDGWYNIIDAACGTIEWHIAQERKEKAHALRKMRRGANLYNWEEKIINTPSVQWMVASQVKEKFGTLRFYASGGDSYCEGVIAMAEYMSSITCDVCGRRGSVQGKGWLVTRCEKCKTKEDHLCPT